MKIFLSLIGAIVSGLILGYIPAKIFVAFNLEFLGVLLTFLFGTAGGAIAVRISTWTRNNIFGLACGLIIGLTAYYNYQLHLYLPIKRNPPENTRPSIVALKNSPEPQGFFQYLQITASDEADIFTRRRGRGSIPKVLFWIVEIAVIAGTTLSTQSKLSED